MCHLRSCQFFFVPEILWLAQYFAIAHDHESERESKKPRNIVQADAIAF